MVKKESKKTVDPLSTVPRSERDALAMGIHNNPFARLGLHNENGVRILRTVQPQAYRVEILDTAGKTRGEMHPVHPGGVFEAVMPSRLRNYRFRIHSAAGEIYEIEDAYRFPSTLGDLDLHLFGEGSHKAIFNKLGAHPATLLGIDGTSFAVWAPNASRVSVIGDFNGWDGRRHVMRLHPANGIWEIFIPHAGPGDRYKFEMLDPNGRLLPLKSDPLGQYHEAPPGNASIVFRSEYQWRDGEWMSRRSMHPKLDQPISIYELHLGSWRRTLEGGFLSYGDLADQIVEYVQWMGFTHVELMPVTEHPFDGSWGYQATGMFAPTQRFGDPDEFRYLVDRCHEAGIAVILDWVPAHFPKDAHALARFDGTALYEHEDPRRGEHVDWGTLIYNYGRREVINFLIGSALYWVDEFHVDALRVDAVASMLYLDYSREDGEWLPNEQGGNENLEAVEFLKRLNAVLHEHGATSYAEESTAWPGVSKPTDAGGLGFTYKWNMGWMNDTLSYMPEDPIHRRYHHDKMTFGLVYAFNENFVLPLSHDEVVHGKRSLIGRMPGDEWQQFANLRAYYAFMYAHPGKKLIFMGGEFAQRLEWSHDRSLDWHLADLPLHGGVQIAVRDMNHVYRSTPALFEQDFDGRGFEWIEHDNRDDSIFSWIRWDRHGGHLICVCNFTPVPRESYRLGVPGEVVYKELLNTDKKEYGGSGKLNPGSLKPENKGAHGHQRSLRITLPPLATIYIAPE